MKLVFFDMDGVLTPKPHPIFLAEIAGRKELFERAFEESRMREIGLEDAVERVVTVLAGTSASVLEEAGKRLPIMAGAVQTVRELKRAGYHPILVTNGFEQVAGVFASRLGIAEWYANSLEIRNGVVTGYLYSSPLVTIQSKGDLVRRIVAHKSSRKECVAVGNDMNDAAMFREAGYSILFNSSSDLRERLAWYLNKGENGFRDEFSELSRNVNKIIVQPDLRLLIPILVPWFSRFGPRNLFPFTVRKLSGNVLMT